MALEMTTLQDTLVVMMPQRLDANNAPGVESDLRTFLSGSPKKMVLDFSETEYIASAGLKVILVITRDFMKTGGRVALVELRQTVRKVFEMAGFTNIFMICISREEAIQKMK
jgi:stage II sporulation protein AA (anti-sigma F factor antagonist)